VAVAATVGGLVTAIAPAALAESSSSMEQEFVSDMNAARAQAGLPGYAVSWDLVSIARQHSADMASSNTLYHNPNLTTQVQNWRAVGENVGVGPSVSAIQNAFMNSTEHRDNILDHDFTQVGVGVAYVNGRVWVTEDFRQPMNAGTASAPAPVAAAPAPPAPVSALAPVAAVVNTPAAPTPAQQLDARLAVMNRHAAPRAGDPLAEAFDFARVMTSLAG